MILSIQNWGQLSCNACIAVFFYHNPYGSNYSKKVWVIAEEQQCSKMETLSELLEDSKT